MASNALKALLGVLAVRDIKTGTRSPKSSVAFAIRRRQARTGSRSLADLAVRSAG